MVTKKPTKATPSWSDVKTRLADFDRVELSNLNRIPATVFDLGINKAVATARRIAELDGSVDLFDFDAEMGQLDLRQSTRIMPPGFTEAPWSAELRVTPNGAFLYTCERRSSTLTALAVDVRNGQLSSLGHYPTETQPRGMGIDPAGRWLVAAGQLSSRLTVYAIDPATLSS